MREAVLVIYAIAEKWAHHRRVDKALGVAAYMLAKPSKKCEHYQMYFIENNL